MEHYPRTTPIPYIAPGPASVNEAQRKREMWQNEDHVPYLPNPYAAPEHSEPNFSMVERIAILLTCVITSVAGLMFIYGAVKVVQVANDVARQLCTMPGVSC